VKKGGVVVDERLADLVDVAVLGDGFHGAGGLACAAVDAFEGVDVELAPALVDAVDRALLHARLVGDVDAGLGDHKRHDRSSLSVVALHELRNSTYSTNSSRDASRA
jgi:hypothetical protein